MTTEALQEVYAISEDGLVGVTETHNIFRTADSCRRQEMTMVQQRHWIPGALVSMNIVD